MINVFSISNYACKLGTIKDNYSVLKCVISEIIICAFIFIIEFPPCFYRDATRDSVSHVVTIDDQRTKTDTTD